MAEAATPTPGDLTRDHLAAPAGGRHVDDGICRASAVASSPTSSAAKEKSMGRADSVQPPHSCKRHSEEGPRRSRWRSARCASWFLLAFGVTVAAASGRAGADGQKNDIWSLPPDPRPLQQPIVNGHHVQPRPDDFSHPEFTPSQSMTVDDLYLQIKRMQDGEAAEAIRVLRGRGD
jgi:hypothetical protein